MNALKINYWAVIAAAVAAFVLSSVYYSPLLLGNVWRAVDPRSVAASPSPGKVLGELVRTFVIAYVLARLIGLLGAGNWKSAIGLTIWLWFGFSAMMWLGAIMWENAPWQVAAIHTGDWLAKTVLMAVILGVWRK
jgi:hypothetical protein